MNYKRWGISFITVVVILLILIGSCTFIIDPYFHYHKPISELEYPLNDQRYQNDGIVKHFKYDAIITGTSMTENFKTSEFDNIFGVNSVKVPFSGGSYKEINDNLVRALEASQDIRCIIRGLDSNRVLDEKDSMNYTNDFYPWYLYDDIVYNDVKYIFNKHVLFENTIEVLQYTKNGNKTPTFDQYSNWMGNFTFNKEAVDKTYTRGEKAESITEITEENLKNITENIGQNVTSLAKANPDLDFYYFFTPYSIYWWDSLKQSGTLERQIQAFKVATEQILECDNIYLFAFFDEYEIISDLNNYKDTAHYGEDLNSQILQWMYDKEHLLVKSNYEKYWDDILSFYSEYEYDKLFEPQDN